MKQYNFKLDSREILSISHSFKSFTGQGSMLLFWGPTSVSLANYLSTSTHCWGRSSQLTAFLPAPAWIHLWQKEHSPLTLLLRALNFELLKIMGDRVTTFQRYNA